MITYGTNPGMGIPVGAPIPAPSELGDAQARAALSRALRYMDLEPGTSLLGHKIDLVFVG